MSLGKIYYELDNCEQSNEGFISFLLELSDEEVIEEMSEPRNVIEFIKEHKLNKVKEFQTTVLDLMHVGKYVKKRDTVSNKELPAKILLGFRDRIELLDALDITPDFNSRK